MPRSGSRVRIPSPAQDRKSVVSRHAFFVSTHFEKTDYLIVKSSFAKAMEDEAGVVELVDTQDLKSCGLLAVRVQVPPLVRLKPLKRGFFRLLILCTT